jgi:sugar phosphate isomerase/epimerase
MNIAEEAGFDAIELIHFRFLWEYPQLSYYREEAAARGLDLHFHEAWGWNGDSTHPEVRIPALWGGLLPSNASLAEQFGDARENIVAYGLHWQEVANNRIARPNWTLQTATTIPDGNFDCSFPEFLHAVDTFQLPLTLDTQHLLEYQIGKFGVENLAGISSSALMRNLVDFFDKHQGQIREIHLNNFDPTKGHRDGRNVWPNQGVLDLRAFCQHVKASGWKGAVTPELHPRFFSRISTKKNVEVAKRLLGTVRELWA